MKLLFFGDSITDAGRERGKDGAPSSYGYGFVRAIAGKLLSSPRYTILNRAVEQLAEEFALPFIPLQKDLDALAQRLGAQAVLADGVHPNIAGAELIAEKWLSAFRKIQGINDEDI